jgi:hypothetical protein
MEVTKRINGSIFKVFIDEILHLILKTDEINGIHSWIEKADAFLPTDLYYIKISVKKGNDIVLDYEERALWEAVLDKLQYCL